MLFAPPVMPAESDTPESTTGLSALLRSAAFAPLDSLGWIQITGDDRVRWLNGMVTNSIQALTPGDGCYNFFLNAQGRIQGDATAFLLDDSILLETSRDRLTALIALLDRFIIMDDVELKPVDSSVGLLIAGPDAEHVLDLLGLNLTNLPVLRVVHTTYKGADVNLIHAYSPLVPRFELWAATKTIAAITAAIALPQASADDLEDLRILEGTPLFGTDIRDRDLPQETAQTRALHFAKGCYLGQEIVERIRSRGNVHRTFSGFKLNGEFPAPGTQLFASDVPDKPIGELTSASRIDQISDPACLALGFIRREALDRNAMLKYNGGTATATLLPFRT